MVERIWRLLPPISGGSGDPDAPALDTPASDPVGDTPAVDPPAPEGDAPPVEPPKADDPFERPFVDPSTLPDELKPHWKAMHRAHNKKLDEVRAHKADIDLLAKFRTDRDFATQLLQAEAQRLGLNLSNGTPNTPPAQPAASDGPPARLVEAVKARLDPSLHWMAESMAASTWEAAREANRPLVEKERARDQATRDSEWGALSGKLTETAPGWEAHESDMNELHDWLRSSALTHPRWGSKLEFLYNGVTNGSAATAQAIQRMGDAARNRTSTGQSSRSTLPNVTERVRKATSPREALQIAAQEAERELKASGIAVPD